MAENFTKFLIVLAENPKALDQFKTDPDGAAKEAGLTLAERSILISKDTSLIRNAIATDIGLAASEDASGVTVVIWTYVKDLLSNTLNVQRDFSKFSKKILR